MAIAYNYRFDRLEIYFLLGIVTLSQHTSIFDLLQIQPAKSFRKQNRFVEKQQLGLVTGHGKSSQLSWRNNNFKQNIRTGSRFPC